MEHKQVDSDQPVYHVMPRDGWLNDPNGPIYFAGRYHLFYQHVIGSSTWDWGLVWGHASSLDLVNWEHEPIAIEPSKERYDADGCWSGNVAVEDGIPTMLYTGVRLRGKPSSIKLPPASHDLDLEQIETQCVARCRPGDESLVHWEKLPEPVLHLPPSELGKLTGFRDPFVFARKTESSPWKIIVGSGVEGRGGTILLYHAQDLKQEWEFQGELVTGRSDPCANAPAADLGAMWECPFFVELQAQPSVWMLCVSPYPHALDDRPTNPCLYWLGALDGGRFRLDGSGPWLLDLGDILYAPTLFAGTDRVLMVAWLQELRKGGAFDYAGCLSVPRVLTLEGGQLRQDPIEELTQLRTGKVHEASDILLDPERSTEFAGPPSPLMDITVTLERRQSAATALLLRPWLASPTGGRSCAEAIMVDWETAELLVVSPDNLDESTMTFDRSRLAKRIGGPLRVPPGDRLRLRLLVDHSLVEVFTEHGQALTTRIYRSGAPPGASTSLWLCTFGGESAVPAICAHELRSIWRTAGDVPEPWHVRDA